MMENSSNSGRLFVFNPDCELAIANGGKFYMPPANIQKMAEDLAFLPAWLATEGDYVLVTELPDTNFYKTVCRALKLRVFPVKESELELVPGLQGEPWGLSPKICHWLAERKMKEEWRTEQKEWYSRKIAREGLIRLQGMVYGVEADILPRVCYSLEDIEKHTGDGCYLIKAPWSSSGKGLLALNGQPGTKERQWLSGMLRRQGYLMLEKRLDKVKDFAMEFRADAQGIKFIGWSDFLVGSKGEYRGNYIGVQKNIRKELCRYLESRQIEELKQQLPGLLQGLLPEYRGYLGVDMMIYRNAQGNYRLQPCVEINLRYNMGIVALVFSKRYLAAESQGWFTVRFFSGKGKALEEHLRMQQEFPAKYKNNRIISGYFSLAPVNETTQFIASVHCY